MANDAEKNVGSGVAANEEDRGRDESRHVPPPKHRGRSKDTMLSLDKRIADVETSMKTQLEELEQRLDGVESDQVEFRDDAKIAINILKSDLQKEIQEVREAVMDQAKWREQVEREFSIMLSQMESMRGDWELCKRAVTSGTGTSHTTPKIEVPKPSPFVGKREARAVDDFLWETEQYLDGVNIMDDAVKIKTATRYLKDTAALWWRRRYGDIEKGTCTIDTWEDFVHDFKKQFYPENAKKEAKSRLRKLKQSGTVREYVKEFTTLVLEIPELTDEDSLFYFMDGLQGWAKTELERRGVQDLASAIACAEALVEFGKKDSSRPKDRRANHDKGGGEKTPQPRNEQRNEGTKKPPTGKGKDVRMAYKNDGCFLCNGPTVLEIVRRRLASKP